MASIATSLSMRKMRALTPSLVCRMRRRPFAVRTLGSLKGKLRMMASTSCSNFLFAVHRGKETASTRRANCTSPLTKMTQHKALILFKLNSHVKMAPDIGAREGDRRKLARWRTLRAKTV
jgi:hypothetical protein